MANGHSPDRPKGQGGMAQPHTQPVRQNVKPSKGAPAKSVVKEGIRVKPV